ncbi:bifunctional nuclease family protein [Desulfurobacterium atlanticum]|uniref:BFN domain-containing protein n=1 Tax=Desulfurobacterium atlanticum TaxID=240169 RepID=A0A239A1A5_9BACT|nr:bifunctional nuclease family protein [Desulfurobacterium atlanticum]SNR89330.1 hypothetical protein SAMN06265340_11420 [Desulfurobacterium atlanticum]
MVEVSVISVTHDKFTGLPMIILGNTDENFAIPIWIGDYEAELLENCLLGAVPPRPFPYDLICNVIASLDGEVEKVVINQFDKGIYFASIFIKRKDGEIVKIDARPSDSINIAVRTGAPIFVTKEIIEKACLIKLKEENSPYSPQQKRELEKLLKYIFDEEE